MSKVDFYLLGAEHFGVTREQFKKEWIRYMYSGEERAKPAEHNMDHMAFLEEIAKTDIEELRRKEKTYGGSWKKRGGIGAYHVSVRVMDRLEKIVEEQFNQDIFAAIRADCSGADGSALAQVRDYRRYLMLIESQMMAEGVVRAGEKIEETPLSPPCEGIVGSEYEKGWDSSGGRTRFRDSVGGPPSGAQLPCCGAVVGCKIGEHRCNCGGSRDCQNHPEYEPDPFVAKGG